MKTTQPYYVAEFDSVTNSANSRAPQLHKKCKDRLEALRFAEDADRAHGKHRLISGGFPLFRVLTERQAKKHFSI